MEILGINFSIIYDTIAALVLAIYNSKTLIAVKLFLGVYGAVLLVDIILLMVQRWKSGAIAGDFRDTTVGMDVPEELTTKKKKLRRQWYKIREKLDSDNESEWKVAIIEADNLIDDLLKRMGYKGENMAERIQNIVPGQVEKLEELKEAHSYRNKIIHEEEFQLTRDKAKEIIALYEEFLITFEVLE